MSLTTTVVPAPPPLPPAAIIGTLVVIAGDVMLFAGLLFAFWVVRLSAPVWPPPLQPRLPVEVTAVNTLILLASAPAVAAGLRAARRQALRIATRWIAGGAALGALFVVGQGYEWIRLIGFGVTVTSGTYGGLFYMVIGAHALHVIVALAWLTVASARVRPGRAAPGGGAALDACALYWYFVVALWPLLYVTVYLL
jgi:heme/copper-type cytochrome/quinol oxidase subunit 3